MLETYIPVRKSQIFHYLKTPLFVKTENNKYILYKSEKLKIDPERFSEDGYPQLYIPGEAKELASAEVQNHLKEKLIEKIKDGNLKVIKSALCDIVQESFQEPFDDNLQTLPETLDIMYQEYANTTKLVKSIADFQFGGTTLAEHSVNTMVLTLNYCIYNGFSEDDIKRFSLGALLHDIGLTKLPKNITGANRKLSDQEFSEYKTHPALGHDIIKENLHMDSTASLGVLEHHERIDGQGYPRGISNISLEGSLIGMVDCFENLTNTEREHRKKKDPFGALKIIQSEILHQGKFDRELFKNLCLSLKEKTKYNI